MAHYIHIDNYNARDTITGDWVDVVERPVWYEHLHKNILGARVGSSELHFTPCEHLSDVRDSDDEFSRARRLVVVRRELETGHMYSIVVAVQATYDSIEYVDCIVEMDI